LQNRKPILPNLACSTISRKRQVLSPSITIINDIWCERTMSVIVYFYGWVECKCSHELCYFAKLNAFIFDMLQHFQFFFSMWSFQVNVCFWTCMQYPFGVQLLGFSLLVSLIDLKYFHLRLIWSMLPRPSTRSMESTCRTSLRMTVVEITVRFCWPLLATIETTILKSCL